MELLGLIIVGGIVWRFLSKNSDSYSDDHEDTSYPSIRVIMIGCERSI